MRAGATNELLNLTLQQIWLKPEIQTALGRCQRLGVNHFMIPAPQPSLPQRLSVGWVIPSSVNSIDCFHRPSHRDFGAGIFPMWVCEYHFFIS
jgi:hypothetical protein